MADRWIEVDVDWFDPDEPERDSDTFVKRLRPLLAAADGERGIIVNVGWLSDVVTLWSGDLDQPLPLQSRRYARWLDRCYRHLQTLVAQLRQACDRYGLPGTRVGLFTVGWGEFVLPEATGEIYDLRSEWRRRQPDLYAHRVTVIPGADLDPRVPLVADASHYASRPDGLQDGDDFGDFFAAQWGALSRDVGLDVFHFRDGWLGPLVYRRSGPYGTLASTDAAENASWTATLRRLFTATKAANPTALLLLYSSAMSATAEWVTGCVDLEQVLADDAIDAFVDQSWGGAWQDWWPTPALGWTFQLANVSGHAAVVRGAERRRQTPCRHYRLVETWDGWEPWDTLHRTPEKLRWGIWATAHAGTVTPEGPRGADGAYISWMNDPQRELMSDGDVAFVEESLAEAEASAAAIDRFHGPLLVHNRAGLTDVTENSPGQNPSAWVEDVAGMLLKWGVPMLASVRAEDCAQIGGPDGLLLPLAGSQQRGVMAQSAVSGTPVVLIGRADLVDPEVLGIAGVEAEPGVELPSGQVRTPQTRGLTGGYDVEHLPRRVGARATPGATTERASLAGEPLVVRQGSSIWWATPDWNDPSDARLDHDQLGSLTPYVGLARIFGELLGARGALRVAALAEHQSCTVLGWTSGGRLHVLLGNLETGWTGDSRHEREVQVHVPLQLHPDAADLRDEVDSPASVREVDGTAVYTVTVPPEGMVLLRTLCDCCW